jgi:hypothetical protein
VTDLGERQGFIRALDAVLKICEDADKEYRE